MKRIAILGSTGSVGCNALKLIAERRDRFDVVMLAAHTQQTTLIEQCREFEPAAAVLVDRHASVGAPITHRGADGILDALAATRPDIVLNAITGAAGLPPSEWTLRNGRDLALANKESMVMAGPYLMDIAAGTGSRILPVDSEHCAIHQCLKGVDQNAVRRIYLTASGGPFRATPKSALEQVTVQQALAHPTWNMGPRITIGSATLMNKAFEVIEARWLFDLPADRISVVVHPQSIVHSMIELVDGSMLAQLGLPDMRVPILYCLGWPERLPFDFAPFDIQRFANLTFEDVDHDRFGAIQLAFAVLEAGGDSGAVLNAADEVMTDLFLKGKVPFAAITRVVADVLAQHRPQPIRHLDDVLAADRAARATAASLAARL